MQCDFVFVFELAMRCVDTVCGMSNRLVSHGRPMDAVQPACTLSQIELNFIYIIYLYILMLVSDLPTVRQFLLKQTQLKCVMFGELKDTEKDAIDTVKVSNYYRRIATKS